MTLIQAIWQLFGGTVITTGVIAFAFVATRVAVGAQARYVEQYSFTEQMLDKDNAAVNLRLLGVFAGLFVAFAGAYRPAGIHLLDSFGNATMAVLGALGALMISRYVNDHLILHRISNHKEVVQQSNVAVSIVEVATFVATGFIFAGGMKDASHGFVFNATWFVVGQAILVGLGVGYRFVFPKIIDQIESTGNVACACSLGGLLIAGGYCVGSLISGAAQYWLTDFLFVIFSVMLWVAAMLALRFVYFATLVSRDRLTKELVDDRNWSLGLIDGMLYIAFTVALVAVLVR